MKKWTSLLLVFSLLFTTFALFSCGESGNGEGEGNEGGNAEKPITYMTLTEDYKIIAPKSKKATEELVNSYLELNNKLKATFDINATYEPDTTELSDYEILLENTNRFESSSAMESITNTDTTGYHCFKVKVVGKKIVIVGNTLTAIHLGTQWFGNQYLTEDSLGIPDNLDETRYVLTTDLSLTPVYYTEAAAASLAFATSISYDGTAVPEFNKGTLNYNVMLPKNAPVPVITAEVLGGTTVSITQPTEANSYVARIAIMSKNSSVTKEYIVKFTYDPNTYPTATIEKSFGGAEATVVIVHDDGSESTATFLAQEFERYDLRGTIGLITNKICSYDADGNRISINQSAVNAWQKILDTGRFIITSHSRTHTYWGRHDDGDSGKYNYSDAIYSYNYKPGHITNEVKGSQDDIKYCFPSQRAITFIKPGFGKNEADGVQITSAAYEIIEKYYVTMRNTGGGVETIPAQNPYSIKSYMVRGGEDVEDWKDYVDEAIENNGMIVYLFHNINDSGSNGGLTVKKTEADALFKYIGEKKAEGKVWVADFEQASLYTEEYRTATVTAVQNDTGITLTVTDDWDNTLYNQALTVKLEITEDSWNTVRCLYESDASSEVVSVIRNEDGTAYIYVNVVPDSGSVIIYKNS